MLILPWDNPKEPKWSFIPWENRTDAFLVADTQKSDHSSLSLHAGPNAFVQSLEGNSRLQLHYTEEEARRSIRAYVTTLLGSLRCRTNVQVAGGKGMLLRYVTSHVTKMHVASTSKGLYSSDVSGYQAANSFLWTVWPLAPEMVFPQHGWTRWRSNLGPLILAKRLGMRCISFT